MINLFKQLKINATDTTVRSCQTIRRSNKILTKLKNKMFNKLKKCNNLWKKLKCSLLINNHNKKCLHKTINKIIKINNLKTSSSSSLNKFTKINSITKTNKTTCLKSYNKDNNCKTLINLQIKSSKIKFMIW
jgi:hypothetical protein